MYLEDLLLLPFTHVTATRAAVIANFADILANSASAPLTSDAYHFDIR